MSTFQHDFSSTSQGLMAELFGDDVPWSPKSRLSQTPQTRESLHTENLMPNWQQTLHFPDTMLGQPSRPLAPAFPEPDVPFEALMSLALPPHAMHSYQPPLYFYPTQHYGYPFQTAPYQTHPQLYQAVTATFPAPAMVPESNNFYSGNGQDNIAASSYVPLHYIFPDTRFVSPTPSTTTMGSSDSQSSSTSSKRERTHRPTYIPRVSRTTASLAKGVFCDLVFRCDWHSCGAVLQVEGPTEAEETAFQDRVLQHLNEHAVKSADILEGGKHLCRWGACHRQLSATVRDRGMVRHLQSHLAAWYYFCQNAGCDHTSSRRIGAAHLKICTSKARPIGTKAINQKEKPCNPESMKVK
ncbi:hypothetical protein DXG01_001751 [Tephrocybe rancida]|nr:hypothetical protein DXG01_001751 [Tephrocybe rancida]